MARFKVKLTAEKDKYPVLLSNGDSVKSEEYVVDGKWYHSEVFVDPLRKPTYLFAIVAGPLENHHDTFTTMGTEDEPCREVDIYVYGEKRYMDQLHWALECVKKAMKWDEVKYGRVYDLSTFRVVCIDDFNAGAMENKSLTTFNVSCVIAHKDSRSDAAFMYVSQVLAHEYCHNWSGDRVTVRDWFQITLKEGFTNFRDHDFAEDHYSKACCRVSSIGMLRAIQFPEDAGAMSHPIRPESYITVDNFYTATVYDKGREVIRMYRVLVGDEGFRKGTDLYFKKYDGKAISCDEFRGAMAEANHIDLTQFERWYTQKGTPTIKVLERKWDSSKHTYLLKLQQIVPPQALGQTEGKPYHMPILLGLIGKNTHKDLVNTQMLVMTEQTHTFTLDNVKEDCVPSVLRDFSAPVKLDIDLTNDELAHLMTYDTDPYNMWQANMTVYRTHIYALAAKISDEKENKFDVSKVEELPAHIARGFEQHMDREDVEFAACCMVPEAVQALMMDMKPYADPIALYKASDYLKKQVANKYHEVISKKVSELQAESAAREYELSTGEIGRRSLLGVLMHYMNKVEIVPVEKRGDSLFEYMKIASNYTERESAFRLIVGLFGYGRKKEAIEWFYNRHKENATIIDSWVAIQCSVNGEDGMELFNNIMNHPEMQSLNPNRFRSAVRTFASNITLFHNPTGEGYQRFAKEIVKYDQCNPYTASVCAKVLLAYNIFSKPRQDQIKAQLKWMSQQDLSKNLREIVTRGLQLQSTDSID